MLNDPRETMAAALKWLGYSLNTTDQAELDEAVRDEVVGQLGAEETAAAVLFLVVHGSALAWSRVKKVETPAIGSAFVRFLTLFWWTAPLADTECSPL